MLTVTLTIVCEAGDADILRELAEEVGARVTVALGEPRRERSGEVRRTSDQGPIEERALSRALLEVAAVRTLTTSEAREIAEAHGYAGGSGAAYISFLCKRGMLVRLSHGEYTTA